MLVITKQLLEITSLSLLILNRIFVDIISEVVGHKMGGDMILFIDNMKNFVGIITFFVDSIQNSVSNLNKRIDENNLKKR